MSTLTVNASAAEASPQQPSAVASNTTDPAHQPFAVASDITNPAHRPPRDAFVPNPKQQPYAPTSDITDPDHQAPQDTHVANLTHQSNTTLALEFVAEHLSSTEDGVRIANKLSPTCTALRGVGASTRAAFVGTHNALLDHLRANIHLGCCLRWIRFRQTDPDHEDISEWLADIVHYWRFDISEDDLLKYSDFVDAIVLGLKAPHFDTLLYNRCLQIINDLHYWSRIGDSEAAQYRFPGPEEHKQYYHVFYGETDREHNVEMEACMSNGGVLGIINMMKAFISGSFVDEALLLNIHSFWKNAFDIRCMTPRCLQLAMEASPDRNIIFLLHDFYSIPSCETQSTRLRNFDWTIRNLYQYQRIQIEAHDLVFQYEPPDDDDYLENLRRDLTWVRDIFLILVEYLGYSKSTEEDAHRITKFLETIP